MKRFLIMAALLFGAAPAAAQSVEVAEGDWSQIPEIERAGDQRMSGDAFGQAARLLERGGACEQSKSRKIDMTVPFIMEFSPEGSVKRIIIRRLGCPQLEALMGGVVKQLALAGEYKPTGENLANWYRSEISFSIR
jgi:hypothetical protein